MTTNDTAGVIDRIARAANHVAAAIKTTRDDIAEFAANPNVNPLAIADQVNDLAKLDGEARMYAYALVILQSADADTVAGAIIDRLAEREDTWSGRTNDVRRCTADGQAEAARKIMGWLR